MASEKQMASPSGMIGKRVAFWLARIGSGPDSEWTKAGLKFRSDWP